ncbi:MAG: hypothetical protein H6577_07705 [Lewinellaceae bacterium]|nr:hypothetical protein [Saprospiraceae bacterium]MCB9337998.1 hypothetical protein [Lewinellaceae bacterium]
MKRLYPLLLALLLFSNYLCSQDFSGTWQGEVAQDGKSDTYQYRLDLTQMDNKVNGIATSVSKTGTVAKFEVGGIWDGQTLALQEVNQFEPPGARWCLKHIRLTQSESNGTVTLEGRWEAQGCTPGKISLSQQSAPSGMTSDSRQPIVGDGKNIPSTVHHPPLISGKWAGYLTQSDRDYGFYFEMKFEEAGKGTSHITSDGEGGNAVHQFHWTFDEKTGQLDFEETAILEESVPSWRWCIKSGSLFFKQEENRLSLAGDWKGYIEGYSLETGACAPGKLYVEKPVFKKEEMMPAPQTSSQEAAPAKPVAVVEYEKKQKREVDVERVLEVKNKTIRIRVWDNGTVDGDVCTLFLNGEMILKNYRVARSKHETIVKLEKPVNYIILHAMNLGSISPNTIAVSVDDGTGEQVVIVSSNLKTSGAIMIREFTVGGE